MAKVVVISDTTSTELRSLGLGIRLGGRDFAVTKTFVDGQCYSQGIRIGDTLLSINGKTLSSLGIDTIAQFTETLPHIHKPCRLGFKSGGKDSMNASNCFSCFQSPVKSVKQVDSVDFVRNEELEAALQLVETKSLGSTVRQVYYITAIYL